MEEEVTLFDLITKNHSDEDYAKELQTVALHLKDEVVKHQKRVIAIMPEYDLHDDSHLEAVAKCISDLIGQERLEKMSAYDLFFLATSAYMHDCGMAPSDWEIKLYKLTEGYNQFKELEASVCNDMQTPYTYTQAKEFIKNRKSEIYVKFEGDVKDLLFLPDTEDKLINYLSNMLCKYQEFRNGYKEKFEKIETNDQFITLNKEIRTDFIRTTHADRAAEFINNTLSYCDKALSSIAADKLLEDLAMICNGHGQQFSDIEKIDSKDAYYDGKANLQFVAQMLRLGDIIHFDQNRAPRVLRNAIQFDSSYSYKQWDIKDTKLKYTIKDGEISYTAYCGKPSSYYMLKEYMGWIDNEINNFNKLKANWDELYRLNIKQVKSSGIKANEKVFRPAEGKKFRLEHNKILNLLVGSNLYSSKYACIRELYQNSLDACRCMISRRESEGVKAEGKIEFGIKTDDKGRYLYCLDNGIGMTDTVIDKYLLNIGSSYYKSADFYRANAQWKNAFTPTSQFGIGMLSCFMIGNSIAITTRADKENKYKSFSIEGVYESFYYTNTSEDEKELIGNCGTLVKVYLKDDVNITSKKFENEKELLAYKFNSNYARIKKIGDFQNDLLGILAKYVRVPFKNIKVSITRENEHYYYIESFKYEHQKDCCVELFHEYECEYEYDAYPIIVEVEDLIFSSMLKLIKPVSFAELFFSQSLIGVSCPKGMCVDGIYVNGCEENKLIKFFRENGVLNFTGKLRPQLTTNRDGFVALTDDVKEVLEKIKYKFVEELLNTIKKHNEECSYLSNDDICVSVVWFLFSNNDILDIFNEHFDHPLFSQISIEFLNELVGEKISLADFFNKNEVCFKNYSIFNKNGGLLYRLIIARLYNCQKIVIDNDCNITFYNKDEHKGTSVITNYGYDIDDMFVGVDYDKIFENYDFISNLAPFAPNRFVKFLNDKYCNRICISEMHCYDVVVKNNLISKFLNKKCLYILSDSIHESRIVTAFCAFIPPEEIPKDHSNYEYLKYKKETNSLYAQGIEKGWSILFFNQDISTQIALPGKHTRQELFDKVPQETIDAVFKKGHKFCYTDGTECKKSNT